jgi:hypothetical protein
MHVFGYFGQPAGTRQEPMGTLLSGYYTETINAIDLEIYILYM